MESIKEIINKIDKFCPFYLQEEWDNSGLQINTSESRINKILITLDLTEDIVNYAIENKFKLIITHHPFIFVPLKAIDPLSTKGKIIKKCLLNNIGVLSLHTNLDKKFNSLLAKKLGLIKIKTDVLRFGAIGNLKKTISGENLVKLTQNLFKPELIRYGGDLTKKIKSIAICGGTGTFILKEYPFVDAIITSDFKYHDFWEGYEKKIFLIDIPHDTAENFLIYELARKLKQIFKTKLKIEVKLSNSPIRYLTQEKKYGN